MKRLPPIFVLILTAGLLTLLPACTAGQSQALQAADILANRTVGETVRWYVHNDAKCPKENAQAIDREVWAARALVAEGKGVKGPDYPLPEPVAPPWQR